MTRVNKIAAAGPGLTLVFALSGCAFMPGMGDGNRKCPDNAKCTDMTSPSESDTQRIGKAGIGFVDVPADYIKFVDVDGNDSIQYSDVTGKDIFTLNIVDLSGMSPEERDAFTLKTGADNLAARIQAEGATGVNSGLTKLAGHNAAKIYGVYPDGTALIMLIVEDDEKNIHYISVESSDIDTLKEMVALVENTYAFDS